MLASAQLRNKVSYFKLCPKESRGVTSDYPQSPLESMVGCVWVCVWGDEHQCVSLCISYDLLLPCLASMYRVYPLPHNCQAI